MQRLCCYGTLRCRIFRNLISSKRVVKIPWLVAENQCSPCCQIGGVVGRGRTSEVEIIIIWGFRADSQYPMQRGVRRTSFTEHY